MSITKLLTVIKGGSGSGNFGHSGRPGKRGGSVSGALKFDKSATNAEIIELLGNATNIKPKSITLSEKLKNKYSNQYDFWMSQDSTDAELLRNVEQAAQVPPVILSNTGYVLDGSHRLAVAVKRGMNEVLAYIVER